MSIPPVASVGAVGPVTGPDPAAAAEPSGFAAAVANALGAVSEAERSADLLAQDIASGGDTGVHELMVAMSEASLSLELLVQVRNRALEAYQEIMRMQI